MEDNKNQNITMTKADLEAMMGAFAKNFAAEMNKPSDLEKRQLADIEKQERLVEANRQMLRDSVAESTARQKALQGQCSHQRSDNTYCIAWFRNSDMVVRGTCLHCTELFDPAVDLVKYNFLIKQNWGGTQIGTAT
jgi:hypothetical protein